MALATQRTGTAVATTDPSESSGTAVVVSTVSVSTQNASKGSKWGFAEIAVTDDLGNAVSGALVSGVFSGDISETVDQVVTEANGVATVRTNSTAKPLNNLSFCVTAASASGLQDFAGEQCGSL